MKANYEDFLRENPVCAKYTDDPTARAIFDLLSRDEAILGMIDAAEQDAPALGPCVQAIEDYTDGLEAPTFDVREDYERTVVGRMVKTILAPFGYQVTRQKGLPKKWRGRYFASASCYRLTGKAVMRVVRRIEEIPADEVKGG